MKAKTFEQMSALEKLKAMRSLHFGGHAVDSQRAVFALNEAIELIERQNRLLEQAMVAASENEQRLSLAKIALCNPLPKTRKFSRAAASSR